MSSINTNVAAMAAVRSLSQIGRDLETTQRRVETGLRIANANDDPAVFAIAQNMRADLNSMSAVKDSLAFGTSVLTVARDATTSISDRLGKLKQTITQAQQQGLDLTAMNTQIADALADIDAFARGATFNGVNLLVAGVPGVPGVTDTQLNVVRDIQGTTTNVIGTDMTSSGIGLAGLNANTGAWKVSFDSSFAPGNAATLSLEIDGVTHVFELSDGSAPLTTTPDAVTKVYDVQITGTDSPLQVVSKIMSRMQDAGINAMLSNEGELIIRGATTNATTTMVGATTSQVTGSQAAIYAVEGAIDLVGARLANIAAKLVQVESLETFTQKLTDSVKEGLGALVDADLAEESARLTSLQTRQQLATQSLAIANQQSQSLLTLFR